MRIVRSYIEIGGEKQEVFFIERKNIWGRWKPLRRLGFFEDAILLFRSYEQAEEYINELKNNYAKRNS